jgi:hypothetical protein
MLPVTLCSTKRVLSLSSPAKRVWTYCNMQWRPGKPIIVHVRRTAEALKLKPRTVSGALKQLIATSLLERTQEHVPPGIGRVSRCAEYRLPQRRATKYRPNETQEPVGVFAVLDHGDRKRIGYVQLLDSDLLPIIRELSNAELELLWILAIRDHARDRFGAIVGQPTMSLTAACGCLPTIPPRTLRHAARSLLGRGLAREMDGAAGRLSATFTPAGTIADGLPWGRNKRGRN